MNNKNETKKMEQYLKKIAFEKKTQFFVNNLLTLVVLKTKNTLQQSWNYDISSIDTCSFEYFVSYMYIKRINKF